MGHLKFILSGGGTGGHIYPAIAIANELKLRYPDCDILFVGAKDKMEMQKVPQAGYPIHGLWISGIQRKLTLQNLLFPVKLLLSILISIRILKAFKPDVVIGTGGFASGPLLKAAAFIGIPTVLQEQNSYPGITNKWLSKSAQKICVAYDGLERFFPKEKLVFTGNPVRQDLIFIDEEKEQAITYFGLNATKKTLLVLGGSLGARRINELINAHLDDFMAADLQILWQCGKLYVDTYQSHTQKTGVQVFAFIDRMDLAYSAADIIISRSGASSVSELCLAAKPTIFIPSPNVTADHQTKNAQAIVSKKAAIMIKEESLEQDFKKIFFKLLKNGEKQGKLSKKIYKLARPNATQNIVNEIIKLIQK
jgi:UDP-N-acetylglucosamine--N-acetylmuramyl-(pentapeptide) pyrophosphoryl-undecaprenol N-acetylglucosamine transferase